MDTIMDDPKCEICQKHESELARTSDGFSIMSGHALCSNCDKQFCYECGSHPSKPKQNKDCEACNVRTRLINMEFFLPIIIMICVIGQIIYPKNYYWVYTAIFSFTIAMFLNLFSWTPNKSK